MRGVFPLIARPLVFAWLLGFTGVFLELPISQLLYAPSLPPVSVAITDVGFRDRGHEHASDLPRQPMISGVFSAGRVGRGETVGLHFEPSGCMIFPRNGAPAA